MFNKCLSIINKCPLLLLLLLVTFIHWASMKIVKKWDSPSLSCHAMSVIISFPLRTVKLKAVISFNGYESETKEIVGRLHYITFSISILMSACCHEIWEYFVIRRVPWMNSLETFSSVTKNTVVRWTCWQHVQSWQIQRLLYNVDMKYVTACRTIFWVTSVSLYYKWISVLFK